MIVKMAAPIDHCTSEEEIPFTVIVEGNTISCDKHQLMKQSEYFRGMLESSMVESRTNMVTLHEMKFDTVSALINYISSGELQICPDTIEDLIETAFILMIEGAINSCVAYYSSNLDDCNCLSTMILSAKLNIHSLYNQARRHALFYFNKVKNEEEFLHLEAHQLENYLSDSHLNCSNEVEILDALLAWYKYDADKRKPTVMSLLSCFHGEDVLKNDWHLVLDHELVKQFHEDVQSKYFNTEVTDQKVTKKFRKLPFMILTLGGCNENAEFCTDIFKFVEDEKTLKPYLSINEVYPVTSTKMGFQVTVVEKDLYLTGGQESMTRSSWILDVWKLDGFTLRWKKATKLKSPRRHHGACGSNDSIYIIGGFGKFRDILSTVEQYDTLNDCWTDLPTMPFKWFTPTAVFCEDKLFVFKTHMICLDMINLQWTTIKQLLGSGNDIVYSTIPLYHNHYIYEFPYLHEDSDWFYEIEMPELKVIRTNTTTGESVTVPYGKELKLGNKCAVFNGRFYTFGHSTDKLYSGNLNDLTEYTEIGTGSKSGNHCYIVVLPHYPEYKVKN